MKKHVLIFTLLVTLFFTACNCPETEKALPDLIVKSVDVTSQAINGQFNIGQTVDLAIRIANLVDASIDCETSAAEENEHEVGVFYKAPNESTYNLVGTAKYAMPKKEAGEIFSDYPNVALNQAGELFIGDISDASNIVEERDEDNNGGQDQNSYTSGKIGNVKCRIGSEITVVGSIPVAPTPYVTFLEKNNLISTRVKIFNPSSPFEEKWDEHEYMQSLK